MLCTGEYHVIIASMIVFFILNFVENIIHFSIGRNVENKDDSNLKFTFPEKYDLMKIIIIMIFFAILQGVLTYILDKFVSNI